MLRMAEFWVGVAFVAFLLILAYYKVPALIAKALDERAMAAAPFSRASANRYVPALSPLLEVGARRAYP